MKSPIDGYPVLYFEELESTQSLLIEKVRASERIGAIRTNFQSKGKGRFDRNWTAAPGTSLLVSMAHFSYADHAAPWLLGMASAVACARAAGCQLQWPNDLVWNGKKLGGILTELIDIPGFGQIAVVGLGFNCLGEPPLPTATTLELCSLKPQTPDHVWNSFLKEWEAMPEVFSWADLKSSWMELDRTPGKVYRAPDGMEVVAKMVDDEGRLVGERDGERRIMIAAEALWGETRS